MLRGVDPHLPHVDRDNAGRKIGEERIEFPLIHRDPEHERHEVHHLRGRNSGEFRGAERLAGEIDVDPFLELIIG